MSKNITVAFGALIILLLAAGGIFALSTCTIPKPAWKGGPDVRATPTATVGPEPVEGEPVESATSTLPPPNAIHHFALATDLPTDLLDEAPLYYLRSTDAVSDTWATHVAASLGFEGQPIKFSREYAWSTNDAAVLTVYATHAFQSSEMPDGDTGAGSISTAEEAVTAARTWLADRDLLPSDCAVAPEAWPNDRDLPPGSFPAYPG